MKFKYANAVWTIADGVLTIDHNKGYAIDRFSTAYSPDGALRGEAAAPSRVVPTSAAGEDDAMAALSACFGAPSMCARARANRRL